MTKYCKSPENKAIQHFFTSPVPTRTRAGQLILLNQAHEYHHSP